MANLKFYKNATAPSGAESGAIWFDSTNKVIKVYNGSAWEAYDKGCGVKSASWDSETKKLTITPFEGAAIVIDHSDLASAKAVAAQITTLQSKDTEQDTAITKAQTTADSKVNSVTGDNAIAVETDANKDVSLSFKTSNKGNVKFTQDDAGLSADVEIPAATVTGVKSGDKVLNLEGTELTTTLSMDYDSTAKKIYLKGLNDEVLGTVDATDFIKDGMVDSVVYDNTTHEATITFNTASGKNPIKVGLTGLVDTYTAGTGLTLTEGVFAVNTETIATAASVTTAESNAKTYADGLKTTIDAYAVNGKLISGSPTLGGGDITVGGKKYTNSTVADAIDGLKAEVEKAAAGGVLSFGGKTGAITLADTKEDNGSINLSMAENVLSASIEGLGTAAYTNTDAYDAAGTAETKANAVLGTNADTPAANTVYGAKKYAEEKAAAAVSNIAEVTRTGSSNDVEVSVKTAAGSVSSVSVTAPDFGNLYDAKGAAAAVLGSAIDTADKKTVYGAIALANSKIGASDVDTKISTAIGALDATVGNTANNAGTTASSQIKVTVTEADGKIASVSVLAPSFASADQGAMADSAVQKVTTGSANGTIAVDGTDVSVKGLGSAAYTASAAYATAAQGTNADSALQSVSASGNNYITASFAEKANNAQALTVSAATQAVAGASDAAKGLAEASDVKNYVDNHVADTLAWTSFE